VWVKHRRNAAPRRGVDGTLRVERELVALHDAQQQRAQILNDRAVHRVRYKIYLLLLKIK
tara:strand:- start:323 stop:502 length:180 start_codon:yes stop_codon:yes gene_type:complete